MIIQSTRVWTGEAFRPAQVKLERGIITALLPYNEQKPDVDHGDQKILPGLIDVHCHGYQGITCNQATKEGINHWAKDLLKEGCTSFMATTSTAAESDLLNSFPILADLIEHPMDGATILGIHVEGPQISPEFRGAQELTQLQKPDVDQFIRWQNAADSQIKMIAIAPEMDDDHKLIKYCASHGVKVCIGHSGASYEECLQAEKDGATSFTHTFNGMRGLHHRNPGTAGAALSEDNMYAELIGDGVHVHFAVAKILARCKGKDKLILITDSVQVKGLKPGRYEKGLSVVEVKENGCAYLPDGRLAGSSNKLIDEVKKLITIAGVPEVTVINSATINPATFLGLGNKLGLIKENYDADLIVIDDDYQVKQTYQKGIAKL